MISIISGFAKYFTLFCLNQKTKYHYILQLTVLIVPVITHSVIASVISLIKSLTSGLTRRRVILFSFCFVYTKSIFQFINILFPLKSI